MSEEMKKSAFKLFAQAQMTYAEAEEKAKQEAGKPKVERFRIGEDGEYTIRILPLAPELDSEGNALPMERKGYEYPLHQLFLGIMLPAKKGKKTKKINIPVVRATDKGIDKSVDIIDTYMRIAKEIYADDEELLKVITDNSYGGGLRWSYQHAMYVLDLSTEKSRSKGPQLWQCSHSQYKSIDDAKMRLWNELRADDEQNTCPISWFTDAYPVKVIRETGTKTDYTIEIGRKCVDVVEAEVEKLLELPRIPELINRFTRYQLEAELVFLQQYDELHDMEVCKEADFIEAVEKLKGELPADDTSHFDLASAGSEKSNATTEVTIDSLWAEYDKIVDADLSEKSDEYQELREKIRQFAEDNKLDVRLSRSKNNQQLLEEIEEAMDGAASKPTSETKPESKPAETKSAVDETEDEEEEETEEEGKEEAPAQPERRRRSRPSVAEETTTNDEEETQSEEQTSAADAEEARPVHRRRRRS